MGGQDSKWEEGAADSGIRGLMSNDGGDGGQRAAGTPITRYTPAMEGDGNAHSSSSPPPWTGCHQSGLSEGQAQSSMGRPGKAATDWPQHSKGPRRPPAGAHRDVGRNQHQDPRACGLFRTVLDPPIPPQ